MNAQDLSFEAEMASKKEEARLKRMDDSIESRPLSEQKSFSRVLFDWLVR